MSFANVPHLKNWYHPPIQEQNTETLSIDIFPPLPFHMYFIMKS